MKTKENFGAGAVRFIRKNWIGYAMQLPFAILFTVFVLAPAVIAIGLSFTDYNMFQPANFVGLKNYELMLVDDAVFWTAVKNTLIFAVIVGPVGYLMSFFVAWVLNQLKMRNAFALAFYAPSITSGVAMSSVWLYFFSSDQYGLINNLLISVGFIDDPILWTQNPKTILPVIIIISVWMSMGTGFLVFLAGLQNVDKTLYEAGAIDGVKNRFQELKYLTLPQMKPQLLFGAITAVTNAFGAFDVAVSVAGLPSPSYAGHTIVAHLYDYAFIRFQMGYASAVATVLFLVTFIVGRVVTRVLSESE
ncbi:MAG: sugar ABC transporter permease [Ruminococcaceae bacterium]|nr:sugar ABC transporter permease [Oscillospiraceae bacterium]